MRLDALTRPGLIVPALSGTDRPTVLRTLAQTLVAGSPLVDEQALYDRLEEREGLGSTAIGDGVAIPHCKMAGLTHVALAIGLSSRGVAFDAADGKPVRLFFAIVSPEDAPALHLQSLAAISRWVKQDEHVARILALDDAEQIYALLESEPSPGAKEG